MSSHRGRDRILARVFFSTAAHANEGGEHEVRSTSKKVWVGVGEGYRSNNWSCGSVHGMLLSDARGFVEEA